MKYFYYINFSDIENDPVKQLAQEVKLLKKPLVRSIFLRSEQEVVISFKSLQKDWSEKDDTLFITVFNGSKKIIPMITNLCKKKIKVQSLTIISPVPTLLSKSIPIAIKNFTIFEKPGAEGKAKLKVNPNTTRINRVCVNDADFLVNSKAIKTQQIEFVKRLNF